MSIYFKNKNRIKHIKEKVYALLAVHPHITNKGLGKAFPNVNINTLRTYKSTFKGSKYESAHIIDQLRWLYNFMLEKIVKGLDPSEKDRDRLKIIEEIIHIEE